MFDGSFMVPPLHLVIRHPNLQTCHSRFHLEKAKVVWNRVAKSQGPLKTLGSPSKRIRVGCPPGTISEASQRSGTWIKHDQTWSNNHVRTQMPDCFEGVMRNTSSFTWSGNSSSWSCVMALKNSWHHCRRSQKTGIAFTTERFSMWSLHAAWLLIFREKNQCNSLGSFRLHLCSHVFPAIIYIIIYIWLKTTKRMTGLMAHTKSFLRSLMRNNRQSIFKVCILVNMQYTPVVLYNLV